MPSPTSDQSRLRFRTYHVDETQYPAAWGARFIWDTRPYATRTIDFLWDRQDCVGQNKADRDRLLALLTERCPESVIEQAIKTARLGKNEDRALVVVDDDDITVTVSPQASYGYLYCTAVLKRTEEQP